MFQRTLDQAFSSSVAVNGGEPPNTRNDGQMTLRSPQPGSDQGSSPPPATNSGLSTSQSGLRISATIARRRCARFCRCQCHTRTTIRLPRWLSGALGTLFYTYTGTPYFTAKACDYRSCHERSDPSARLTYSFPDWMLRRTLSIAGTWRDLAGPGASWTVRMPRKISPSAPIWHFVNNNRMDLIQQCFRTGQASPFDVNTNGESVLSVSHRQR